MKKVIFNGGILRNKNVYGVQRATMEILAELDTMVDKGQMEVIIPAEGPCDIEFKNIDVVTLENKRRNIKDKYMWDQFIFPNYVRRHDGIGVDLVVALPFRGSDISAIYDCRTVLFPENAKKITEKLKRQFYILRVKATTRKSKYIVTDSENAKSDICRLFHCPEDKVYVIHNAWQHFDRVALDESVIEEFDLTGKEYFFSLGSQMRHKNIRWIVYAASQNPQYTFVVTGENKVNEFDSEIRNIKADNIIYTGYLSDEKVKALMAHCKAFIQPSLYEGFGIPPMEAMSVGAKCIVSNTSALPEIYPCSVWYIDPVNYTDICLDEIMQDKVEDNEKILQMYSWNKSAKQLLALINSLE